MTPERVPAGWRSATYGDVLSETEARAGQRCDLPVLSVTKSRGPMLASERFGKVLHSRDLSRYRVAPRDMIVADPMLLWDGSIGIQRVVDAGLVSPDYRVYAPTHAADPAFMSHVVRSPTMLQHYQGGARGTNVRRNRIARSDFLAIPLPLPPLAEQHKIAAILSCLDDALEATQAVIDQLGVVKKAMMAELLTRGLPGRHSRFNKTEIGEVPEGWAVLQLGELIEHGPDNGLYKPQVDYGEGVPIVRIDAFDNGDTITGHGLRRVRATPEEIGRFGIREGDLLVNRVNSVSHIGKSALVGPLSEPTVFESNMMRLALEQSRITAGFAFRVLTSAATKAFFQRSAKQAVAQASINQQDLRALPVLLPPLDEQRLITAGLDLLDARLSAERSGHAALDEAKSALMSVLLSGEVRVKPDDEAA